jgi:hypothetical protein
MLSNCSYQSFHLLVLVKIRFTDHWPHKEAFLNQLRTHQDKDDDASIHKLALKEMPICAIIDLSNTTLLIQYYYKPQTSWQSNLEAQVPFDHAA